MLGNDDEAGRDKGMSQLLVLHKNNPLIGFFYLSTLNLKAQTYNELVDEELFLQQSLAIIHLFDAEIED